MKRLDVGYRIVAILLLMCILMITYLGVVVVVFYRKKNLPIAIVGHYEVTKALDRLEREYNENEPSKTKTYYKNFIEKDLGLKAYIYSENELEHHSGLTYPTIRLIVMDNRLGGYSYCTTFVHEAIHLTEFIQQEDYVTWRTFKYLYESEELHNVGVWFAERQILGYYQGEYNVADFIVDYLTKE
jgi:hypothetical protein